MEQMRRLSHRRTSIVLHDALAELLGERLSPAPVELKEYDDVVAFMNAHPGCYLKMPWSGSGKGIYRVIDPQGDQHVLRWIDGALHRQGSLLCEIGLERLQDFAIECQCRNGSTQFMGYSVFDSDFHSQYGKSKVAPAQELQDYLVSLYPDVESVIGALLMVLDRIVAPYYTGPVGIDMMCYLDDGCRLAINPCVELNLRHTMGMVTVALGSRHGKRGAFAIGDPQALQGERLTPVANGCRYCAMLDS